MVWLPDLRGPRDGLLFMSFERTGGCAEWLVDAVIDDGPDGLS